MNRRFPQHDDLRGLTAVFVSFAFLLSSVFSGFSSSENYERNSQIETQAGSLTAAGLEGNSYDHSSPPANLVGLRLLPGISTPSKLEDGAPHHAVPSLEVLSFAPKNSPPGHSA